MIYTVDLIRVGKHGHRKMRIEGIEMENFKKLEAVYRAQEKITFLPIHVSEEPVLEENYTPSCSSLFTHTADSPALFNVHWPDYVVDFAGRKLSSCVELPSKLQATRAAETWTQMLESVLSQAELREQTVLQVVRYDGLAQVEGYRLVCSEEEAWSPS